MIKNIDFQDFRKEFASFSESYANKFTPAGQRALFDYLEDYEESTDQNIELDVIALCCEYTEYENFAELQSQYPNIKNLEDLEDHTQVILIDGTDRFIMALTTLLLLTSNP